MSTSKKKDGEDYNTVNLSADGNSFVALSNYIILDKNNCIKDKVCMTV